MSIQCPSNQTVVVGVLTDHAAASPPDGRSSRCSYCHPLRWPARGYAPPLSSHISRSEASRPCDECALSLAAVVVTAAARTVDSGPFSCVRRLPERTALSAGWLLATSAVTATDALTTPLTSSSQLDCWSIFPWHFGLTDRSMMVDVPRHAHLMNAGAELMESASLHDPPTSAADRSLAVPTMSPMTIHTAFRQ